MKLRKVLAVAACSLLALPLLAADNASPMKAGKWEVSVQMDMPGMQMPARTFTKCVTKEESENAENAVPRMRDGSCKVSDVNIDGNTISWKIACESQQMIGEGKITYENDSYKGEAHMKMADHEMTMKYSGKRLGDCDK